MPHYDRSLSQLKHDIKTDRENECEELVFKVGSNGSAVLILTESVLHSFSKMPLYVKIKVMLQRMKRNRFYKTSGRCSCCTAGVPFWR